MLILGGNFSAWAFTLGFAKTNSWARARDQGTIVFAENYFARITPCTNVYPRFYSRFKIAITRGFGRLDWRVKGRPIMEARTTLSNIFKDARHIVIRVQRRMSRFRWRLWRETTCRRIITVVLYRDEGRLLRSARCYSPRFLRNVRRSVPRLQFHADCIPIQICITLFSLRLII